MKKALLWLLAFLITASAAVYQRMTGPTYPLRGSVNFEGEEIRYRLIRTHEIGDECEIRVEVPNASIEGRLLHKRHKTADSWESRQMTREGRDLVGMLPSQPPAGKLEYKVLLSSDEKEVSLTADIPIIIRFKGKVPDWVLIPHIFVMFLAMLLSTRSGLEALGKKSNPRKLAIWTTGFLFFGGMILGPLVQHYAFGALWTGFPLGSDLTDNKTLIALIAWIAALIAGRRGKPARGWVFAAAIVLFFVYLIPHSLFGSELDYSEAEYIQGRLVLPPFSSGLKLKK